MRIFSGRDAGLFLRLEGRSDELRTWTRTDRDGGIRRAAGRADPRVGAAPSRLADLPNGAGAVTGAEDSGRCAPGTGAAGQPGGAVAAAAPGGAGRSAADALVSIPEPADDEQFCHFAGRAGGRLRAAGIGFGSGLPGRLSVCPEPGGARGGFG